MNTITAMPNQPLCYFMNISSLPWMKNIHINCIRQSQNYIH